MRSVRRSSPPASTETLDAASAGPSRWTQATGSSGTTWPAVRAARLAAGHFGLPWRSSRARGYWPTRPRRKPRVRCGEMRRRDPLADPAPLIRRVYSYVAYRIGDGPDAEDVTSEVFERALKYRASYDGSRGKPLPWLLGIARRCADDALSRRPRTNGFELEEQASGHDLERGTTERRGLAAG